MAKRRPARAGYHHGDLKRTLIDSALELVRESDVPSLSLRELSRKAGVTTAAPYHHFPDKHALLTEIAAEGLKLLQQRMLAAAMKGGPALRDRVRALAEAHVRFGLEELGYFKVMCSEELNRDKAETSAVSEAGENVFELALGVITEAAGDSLPERERRGLAVTAWAMVYGASALWNMGALRHKKLIDLPTLIRSAGDHVVLLFDGLVAHRARRGKLRAR
ncbi:MAG: TetR/AcrR family transcriptional regulator [Archangiaceae bacterium]|nr:TetR/AcrR family transcriptional regulator [Archangiaceae bacterium]